MLDLGSFIVHDSLSGLIETQHSDMYVAQRLKHLPGMREALSPSPALEKKSQTPALIFKQKLILFLLSKLRASLLLGNLMKKNIQSR